MTTLRISAWLVMACSVAYAQSQPSGPGLDGLKRIYEQESAKIVAEQRAAIEALPRDYTNALEPLAGRMQKAGDLDGLVAVRNELARYAAQGKVTNACVVAVPDPLRELQLAHMKRTEAAETGRRDKALALIAKYIPALETLKKNLTREQKIEEALLVKTEIERVNMEQYFLSNPPGAKPPDAQPPATTGDVAVTPAEEDPPDTEIQPSLLPLRKALRQNRILYYSFNRDGDGKVRDDSGHGLQGVVHGARHTPKGRKGGAYDFDGRTSHITTPEVDATGDMTWSVWFCPRSHPTRHDTYAQIIGLRGHAWVWNSDNTSIAFMSRTADPDRGFYLFFIVQGQREGTLIRLSTPPELNVWHHAAGVIDDTGNHLYLDGKLMATGKPPVRFGSPAAMIIGANDNGPQRHFDGLIDEVMVFNRALTPAEIRALYSGR